MFSGAAHSKSAASEGEAQVGFTLFLLSADSSDPDSLVGLNLVLCLLWVKSAGESMSVSWCACMGVRVITLSSCSFLSFSISLTLLFTVSLRSFMLG